MRRPGREPATFATLRTAETRFAQAYTFARHECQDEYVPEFFDTHLDGHPDYTADGDEIAPDLGY